MKHLRRLKNYTLNDPNMKDTITYFVAVDFSVCSYNALQYATLLARLSKGTIKLVHIIDIDEVVESDNPVVVSLSMDRMVTKANEKMKSLREIISNEGIQVEEEISFGNVRIALRRCIEQTNPTVIVLGRNTDTKPGTNSLVSYITHHTKLPVLLVPRTHDPKIPTRAVLATDMKSEDGKALVPLFEIISKTTNELSILIMKSTVTKSDREEGKWIKALSSRHGIDARLLHYPNENMELGVVDFVRSNPVDLLCTVKRNRNFFQKYFFRDASHELASQVEVPVLVINA